MLDASSSDRFEEPLAVGRFMVGDIVCVASAGDAAKGVLGIDGITLAVVVVAAAARKKHDVVFRCVHNSLESCRMLRRTLPLMLGSLERLSGWIGV